MKANKKELSPKQRDDLLAALKARFDANQARHPGLAWAKVQARLEIRPEKLWSLGGMERTGGEPDVVGVKSGEFIFMDCAAQSLPRAASVLPRPRGVGFAQGRWGELVVAGGQQRDDQQRAGIHGRVVEPIEPGIFACTLCRPTSALVEAALGANLQLVSQWQCC